MKPICIIGAGWAGLSAGVRLSQQNIPVLVFEAAKQLGGRARRVQHNHRYYDNGQHLALGAYQGCLNMIRTVGINYSDAFLDLPMTLLIHGLKGKEISLAANKLPSPLNMASALLLAQGLSVSDKVSLGQFFLKLPALVKKTAQNATVHEVMVQQHLSEKIQTGIFAPLCLAALNTPAATASAVVFLHILQKVFLHGSRHSHLLLPKSDLSSIFPEAAAAFIEKKGGKVIKGQRVNGITLSNGHVDALWCGHHRFEAEQVIIATSPQHCYSLISDHPELKNTADSLSHFRTLSAPIATVYIQYPPSTQLPFPMVGLLDCTGDWVFDLGFKGDHGLMSIVISGHGSHMKMSKSALEKKVTRELAQFFPQWPTHESCFTVREKQATFTCDTKAAGGRPSQLTDINNLWIAGDYTTEKYPATLEAAVLSGASCADKIVNRLVP